MFCWLWNYQQIWASVSICKLFILDMLLVKHTNTHIQFTWCVRVHKTMLILTRASEASDFTPHCSKHNNVSLCPGQILDNNWLTILHIKTSTIPCVFTVLHTAGPWHDPDKLVSGSAGVHFCLVHLSSCLNLCLMFVCVCVPSNLHTVWWGHTVRLNMWLRDISSLWIPVIWLGLETDPWNRLKLFMTIYDSVVRQLQNFLSQVLLSKVDTCFNSSYRTNACLQSPFIDTVVEFVSMCFHTVQFIACMHSYMSIVQTSASLYPTSPHSPIRTWCTGLILPPCPESLGCQLVLAPRRLSS